MGKDYIKRKLLESSLGSFVFLEEPVTTIITPPSKRTIKKTNICTRVPTGLRYFYPQQLLVPILHVQKLSLKQQTKFQTVPLSWN